MLLEELRKIPEFNALEKAVKEKLTSENFYVQHFMPDTGEYYDESGYDENGKREWSRGYTSKSEATRQGIDGLIYDKGDYFDEFICEELRSEVVEFVRVLLKKIRE